MPDHKLAETLLNMFNWRNGFGFKTAYNKDMLSELTEMLLRRIASIVWS